MCYQGYEFDELPTVEKFCVLCGKLLTGDEMTLYENMCFNCDDDYVGDLRHGKD